MKQLLIVQPYIPTYRVPFFALLSERLCALGIDLTVAAGVPAGDQERRRDVCAAMTSLRTSQRSIRVVGCRVRWQGTALMSRRFDAVIYEASGSLVDVSLAIICGSSVGVWGHIDAFVNDARALDLVVERWLIRHAKAVLAYTPRGARTAINMGAGCGRVTALFNTVDTDALQQAVDDAADAAATRAQGVVSTEDRLMTFCFIGGLDESKRIAFLAEVLDALWQSHPRFRLLVAGSGVDSAILDPAIAREQVVLVGRVDDAGKAHLAALSSAMLMPGRVGLVAVESFTLGLPIVTTDWRYHAPEFEYLTPGVDAIVSPDSVPAYTEAVRRLLDAPQRIEELRSAALRKANTVTLSAMVDNFIDGVRLLIPASP